MAAVLFNMRSTHSLLSSAITFDLFRTDTYQTWWLRSTSMAVTNYGYARNFYTIGLSGINDATTINSGGGRNSNGNTFAYSYYTVVLGCYLFGTWWLRSITITPQLQQQNPAFYFGISKNGYIINYYADTVSYQANVRHAVVLGRVSMNLFRFSI